MPETTTDVDLACLALATVVAERAMGRPAMADELFGLSFYRDSAQAVVDALRAAGRLPPEGGETRTEWTATMRKDPADCSQPPWAMRRFPSPDAAREWAAGFAEGHLRLWHRERCDWPDGGRFAGPWVAVDQEATDG